TSYFQLGFWEVGRGIQVRADFQSGVGVLQPNQAFLSRTPISYATESLLPKDERLQGVNVYIAPALLQSWLSDYPLPDHMQKALFHDPSQILVHSTHITALIGHCLKQLRHITPDDPMFRLYTEGKVMEIVALYVDSMLKPEALTQAALTAEDVACIHRAKDILLAQLDDPPSLLQLARAVHINDYKLKVGFKSLFGTTVFGMLYDYRMEKAREMIKRNRDSIAEIAEQVGYKSPKAFATAFKRKYGITPREARS
ncbi:MAG: AraC family transcriptional regulator, partial [Chloroflexota bacterium]